MRRKQRNGEKIIKALLSWIPFVVYINLITPPSIISFTGFYFLLSMAIFFTFNTFFSLGRTIVWLGIIVIYLLIHQLHIDNILNVLILLGIFVTFEIYFRKT